MNPLLIMFRDSLFLSDLTCFSLCLSYSKSLVLYTDREGEERCESSNISTFVLIRASKRERERKKRWRRRREGRSTRELEKKSIKFFSSMTIIQRWETEKEDELRLRIRHSEKISIDVTKKEWHFCVRLLSSVIWSPEEFHSLFSMSIGHPLQWSLSSDHFLPLWKEENLSIIDQRSFLQLYRVVTTRRPFIIFVDFVVFFATGRELPLERETSIVNGPFFALPFQRTQMRRSRKRSFPDCVQENGRQRNHDQTQTFSSERRNYRTEPFAVGVDPFETRTEYFDWQSVGDVGCASPRMDSCRNLQSNSQLIFHENIRVRDTDADQRQIQQAFAIISCAMPGAWG